MRRYSFNCVVFLLVTMALLLMLYVIIREAERAMLHGAYTVHNNDSKVMQTVRSVVQVVCGGVGAARCGE